MRIGELAATCGLTAKTIRFYEQDGLLPAPPRTSGGYRDYPPDSTARLAFIRDAQTAGLTLAEIRSILVLRDSGQAPCTHVTGLIQQHLADIERRMAELRKTRTALRGLTQRAAETDPGTCKDTDVCSIIGGSARR
ncbi:heavy metal-responsive transcriptional regulator [Streptomyces sp. NPDC005407]|uniref:heavy metal-responsive transcriptional regulator n=1 Tax=Streptomyces sp. NPDC005407 TaxID=3155340 RepID=UPI0033B6ECA7